MEGKGINVNQEKTELIATNSNRLQQIYLKYFLQNTIPIFVLVSIKVLFFKDLQTTLENMKGGNGHLAYQVLDGAWIVLTSLMLGFEVLLILLMVVKGRKAQT